jgi:hypothetical protein
MHVAARVKIACNASHRPNPEESLLAIVEKCAINVAIDL